MPADTLLSALHQRFEEDPTLVEELSGGMWTGEVPEGTEPPYAWLEMTGVDFLPTMKDERQFGSIRFHVYTLGPEAAERFSTRFYDCYAYQTLDFSAASLLHCVALYPASARLVCEMLRHKSGALVWRAILSYRTTLQRTR